MRPSFKWMSLVALMLVGALGLAACGSDPTPTPVPNPTATPTPDPDDVFSQLWADTVAAAEAEGTVVVASHAGNYREAVMDAFQEAYPKIKVEFTGSRPSDFSPKLITEQENGVFAWDAMWGSTSNMTNVLGPAGAWQDLKPFLIDPDVLDPDNWKGPAMFWTSDDGDFVFVNNITVGQSIWVNRDLVSEAEFNSVSDLLKPELAGKIVLDDCAVPANGLGAMMQVISAQGGEFAKSFLTEQEYTYSQNVTTGTEWLMTGRFPIGLGVDEDTVTDFQENGIGENVVRFDTPGSIGAAGVGVFRNAPHPNAATVFVNWFLSQAGQLATQEASILHLADPNNSRRTDLPILYPPEYLDASELTAADLKGLADESGDGEYVSWMMESGRTIVGEIRAMCRERRT
jgi:ABC-type Fe3+ transport system substrate-binding protein